MKELELKHLAAYLPYGVKVLHDGEIKEVKGIRENMSIWWYITYDKTGETASPINNTCKPILKPLFAIPQDLVDMSPYDTHDELIEAIEDQSCIHSIYRVAVANHFDVFGLIDAGLAIDINRLNIGTDR